MSSPSNIQCCLLRGHFCFSRQQPQAGENEMNDDNAIYVEKLAPIHKKITESESDSIADRWEFGRSLVELRVGKQLPKGLRARVTRELGLETSEITRRMQLAERFARREEVVDACTTYGGSWRRIIRHELATRPQSAVDSGWKSRAQSGVERLVAEANMSTARRDELVRLLEEALTELKQCDDLAAQPVRGLG
jgi:hypothetical protein